MYDIAQYSLLYYMLKDGKVIEKAEKEISYLPREELRHLFNEIICYYHKYGVIELADFITYISDNKKIVSILYEIINMSLEDGYTNTEINDYIKVIKDYVRNKKIVELEEKMKNEVDPLKQADILKDILNIRGVR